MTEHLTTTELDALLEAAKAATAGPWIITDDDRTFGSPEFIVWGPRGPGYGTVCRTWRQGLTATEDERREATANAALIAAANPATITRLVLMVRELDQMRITEVDHWVEKYNQVEEWRAQLSNKLRNMEAERNKFSELADKRHDDLSEARRQRDSIAAKLNEYARDLIEHFRTRAVRAIDEQRREAPLPQAATWSDAKLLIESLPLVEEVEVVEEEEG